MNFTEHTKIRKEKFGTVVFDTLTEKIFITDEIGSEILCLIKQGKDLPQIISELCGIFDGNKQTIEKEAVEFTDQLRANNIVCA
jgi:hypothetical protein